MTDQLAVKVTTVSNPTDCNRVNGIKPSEIGISARLLWQSKWLVLFGFCLLFWTLSVAAAELPGPPDAQIERIAPSTTSLGMRLSIRRFRVDRSMEQVLDFYRQLWKDQAVETELPPWQMIGTRVDGQYLNVQVQPQGRGAWGYLSISDLPERLDSKQYDALMGGSFPMMNGSQVLDDQVSKDPGKDGRVLLIRNRFSPFTNLNFYKRHYANRGWQLVMDEQVAPRQGAYALYFSKGRESLTLTINRLDGETSIVANHVKRGLLR